MAVDADAIDDLVSPGTTFAAGAQNCNVIAVIGERASLSPNSRIERHRLIFDNN
jgi:NADPH-dependent ferric siderophore reductase